MHGGAIGSFNCEGDVYKSGGGKQIRKTMDYLI